jgi:hypothetical protein
MLSDLERLNLEVNQEFEPFFFFTEGHGVTYLATQEADSTYGQTYRATGSFQNINGLNDGKYIYYMDGRYYDQMNTTSIVDSIYITDTDRHTPDQAKKMIKDQRIQGVNGDAVTLYSYDTYFWFVHDNGLLDPSYLTTKTRNNL